MPSRRFVLAFGALLFVLIAMSRPQRVGDAREYLAMAMNLARLESPALSSADRLRAERRLDELQFVGNPLAAHRALTDAKGRRDFFHFWFYPALAVPGIWIAAVTRLHPNHAFTAVNVLLFLGAAWIASRRLAWWLTAAVFCSPVLWWIDKSHTEAFTFSLLAAALALLPEAPWWSMICLGAAATQNPPIALLLVCVGAVTFAGRRGAWRDRRLLTGASVAGTLALLHPIYYEWRWGLLTPQLVMGTQARVPTLQEFGAVLWDPNIGLFSHAPLLVLTVVVAAVLVGVRARSLLMESDVWLALAGAGIFLLSFSQTTNVNNGATPGMSRYAVWLIPLCIPIFQRATAALGARAPRWFVLLALASSAWSVVAFQPRQPESYTSPTRIASSLWRVWPSLNNPLPEIFTERVSGEEPGLVPIATPDCAKVLLYSGRWPVPCVPQAVPSPCDGRDVLCYANRTGGEYDFVRVQPQAGYTCEPHRMWTWDLISAPAVERILERVASKELRWIRRSDREAMVRASYEAAWVHELHSDEALIAYVAVPREGASLTLSLPGRMSGSLMDPDTAKDIRPVRLDPAPGDLVALDLPLARAVVLVLQRDR